MPPDDDLIKALVANDTRGARRAFNHGAKLPRPSMKHPIFTWLRSMKQKKTSALPMLELLVAQGLDPNFRVKATSDRLGRNDFSATLPNRVTARYGDKGDGLLGRLIYCSQFEAATWLAKKVEPSDLLITPPGSVDTLRSPLERVMIAGQWSAVCAMLDRLQGYPIETDDAAYWLPIHDRALKVQLDDHPHDIETQEQLDRIFNMGRQTGVALPLLPANNYAYGVPQQNLEAWSRGVPGMAGFLFGPSQPQQRDIWEMLISSPSSYQNGSGLLVQLLEDPRFGKIASRKYSMAIDRSSPLCQGTLVDLAMSGKVSTLAPADREIVVDLLRANGCNPSWPPGTSFKRVMASGCRSGDWLPIGAWQKYPGALPADCIAYCRRASQLQELISWGADLAAPSKNGIPSMAALLVSMRARQASNNLRDIAIAVAQIIEARPDLLKISNPITGETVTDLVSQHTSMLSRVVKMPDRPGFTPWALVSACLAGQKIDHRLAAALEPGASVRMSDACVSPWFACVLIDASTPHRRTRLQQNEFHSGLEMLSKLGRWPAGGPMEGFRRLAAARPRASDLSMPDAPSFAQHFQPGELSKAIASPEDMALVADVAVNEGHEMISLLSAEYVNMDTPSMIELFCAWATAAQKKADASSSDDLSYVSGISHAFPNESVIGLLDGILEDAGIDAASMGRIAISGSSLRDRISKEDRPDKGFLAQMDMRLDHLEMHRNTDNAPRSRVPGKRF